MSPRVGPARQNVVVRMSAEGIAAVDEVAAIDGIRRSEAIRRLLAEAIAARRKGHPAKYAPKGRKP